MITYEKSNLGDYVESFNGKNYLLKGDRHYFVCNDSVYEDVSVFISKREEKCKVDIYAENRSAGELVIIALDKHLVDDKENTRVKIREWEQDFLSIDYIDFKANGKDLLFCITYDLNNWKHSFSYDEYNTEFSRIWGSDVFIINYSNRPENIIEAQIECDLRENYKSLKEGIKERQDLIMSFHNHAIQVLTTSHNKILTTFDFPEQLKTSCEQYLLYFAKFLRDLGINATSNLKEEAGKVLFSVTPTDDVEALDKIREALAVYLSLSSNPIPNSTGDRTVDMILSGVRANAKHLESQLELAVAKLQFNEATLELKDATINQNQLALRQKDQTIKELQEIISRGNIFEESLEKIEVNGEVVEENSLYRFNREDTIDIEATPILDEKAEETRIGLVKFHEVTKLKEYGVSIDLPKAIRDLLAFFKRDKSE